jgi:hypothetical protein
MDINGEEHVKQKNPEPYELGMTNILSLLSAGKHILIFV